MVTAKKLNSGNWRCQVYDYTDSTGKKHYKSFTAPTQREAEYAAMTYQIQREHSRTHMTLGEAYDEYLRVKHNRLSPSTRRGYKSARNNHFQALMKLDISEITEDMVQQAVDLMMVRYSQKTISNQYGLLVSVLGMFRRDFHLSVSLGRKQTPHRYIPSSDEVRVLYEAADDSLRVPIILASQGSLRCSEICAVTPDSISAKGVFVTSAIVLDENNHYIRKLPKTDAGYRFTPLSPEAIEICKGWSHFGISPRNLEKKFHDLCEKVGIPTTLHKLRHFWASELHQAGVPDKVIARYGGWDDITTLQKIYVHVLAEHDTTNEEKIIATLRMNKKSTDMQEKVDAV